MKHRWGDPERTERRTERVCIRCDLMKVTRHEEIIWIEWQRDGVQIASDRTPPCDGRVWETGEFE